MTHSTGFINNYWFKFTWNYLDVKQNKLFSVHFLVCFISIYDFQLKGTIFSLLTIWFNSLLITSVLLQFASLLFIYVRVIDIKRPSRYISRYIFFFLMQLSTITEGQVSLLRDECIPKFPKSQFSISQTTDINPFASVLFIIVFMWP